MPLLAPEALGLGDGDAADPDLVQRLLHFVELERLGNRLALLHASDPLRTVRPGSRSKPDQARLSGSAGRVGAVSRDLAPIKSEERTSELQTLLRHSYDVFCLKKKTNTHTLC